MSELVTFVPGINPTRAQSRFKGMEISYYDQTAFESDMNQEGLLPERPLESFAAETLKSGDVVISNALQLATIVGKTNAGKVPSLNFTKVEFHSEHLDKHYFIYLFNAYSAVRRQKERGLQGTGSILRIPIKTLNEIEIPIIPLEKQKKIGQAYKKILQLQGELKKYDALMEQFVYSVLEENLKEIKEDE